MRDKINLDDSSYNQGQQEFNQEEQVVVQNTTGKQVLVILLGTIVGMIILYATIALVFQGGEDSAPDPNRTEESCTRAGVANVYPAMHEDGNCYEDADGYYYPVLGHHHHK